MNAARVPFLQVEGLSKRYGRTLACDAVSLDIGRGELFALLGGSGSGKTTLLRMLAGFERPDEGRIRIDGVDVTDIPPYERPVNLMFQNYALFPHLSVARNIAFGLEMERRPKREIAARVDEMLALVKLEEFAARKPDQLSGGQRQRVALARALAKQPKLLLLDEPLGALDRRLREHTQLELVNIQRRVGTTFVMVTHDQQEAMAMATRVAVMDAGRVVQVSTPADLYESPRTRFVAEFVGAANVFEGRVEHVAHGGCRVAVPAFGAAIEIANARGFEIGRDIAFAIRREKIALAPQRASEGNSLHGRVADIAYLGDVSVFHVELPSGGRLSAQCTHAARDAAPPCRLGDTVWLSFAASACVPLEA